MGCAHALTLELRHVSKIKQRLKRKLSPLQLQEVMLTNESLAKLADKLGVTQSWLSHIRSGKYAYKELLRR